MSDRDTEPTAPADSATTGDTVVASVTNRNHVGRRLKALRGHRGQQEISDLLGISRMSLSRYEAGERSPDSDLISTICRVFGCTSDWLLFGRGPAPSITVDLPTTATADAHEG